MRSLKPVFVLNPIIEQYEKIYIYGMEREAVGIFVELCTGRARAEGFLDEDHVGISFFHRPVYSLHDLDRHSSLILALNIPDMLRKKEYKICTEICVLNPELRGQKVFIYGAGEVGQKLLSLLIEEDIEVIGFIDSNASKAGSNVCGKTVYSNDVLKTLPENTVVIEAGRYIGEIDSIVKQLNENCQRFCTFAMRYEATDIWVDHDSITMLPLRTIIDLDEFFKEKEVLLLGRDVHLASEYLEIFLCLGYKNASVIKWERIEEIIYEENYVILLFGKVEESTILKLTELGAENSFGHVEGVFLSKRREQILDIHMGNTYKMNSEYPGIEIYGKNDKNDYRIAVLGGSTTDGTVYSGRIHSWPEILYDKFCPEGITIFNGGICGYYSGQELIKLIRDMMKLKPDMVIVYDGFNDALQNALGRNYSYLEEMVKFAGRHTVSAWWDPYNGKVWSGIKSEGNAVDDWLDNIKYMHTIAESRAVRFLSFIQPSLFTKKYMDAHSAEVRQMNQYLYPPYALVKLIDNTKQFRKRAKSLENTYGYIYDLSCIFDDVDVYMDVCHVYEKGNEIIAEHIWDKIKDNVR